LANTEVKVRLPKFNFFSDFSLRNELEKLGISRAFSGRAEFSGIAPNADIRISSVVHQAFVEVDENGSKAAAATAVTISPRSLKLYVGKIFFANHPFLFLIRQRNNNLVSFIGRFSRPT
jgi:serpin B